MLYQLTIQNQEVLPDEVWTKIKIGLKYIELSQLYFVTFEMGKIHPLSFHQNLTSRKAQVKYGDFTKTVNMQLNGKSRLLCYQTN